MNIPGMALVYVAAGQLQAEVVRSLLDAAGIPVLLQYESLGLVMGLTVDGLGQVRIYVPADQEEDAVRLLEEDASESAEEYEEMDEAAAPEDL